MKIIIASGGSGGHIFPALSVAEELKKEGHTVMLAGAFGRMTETIRNKGFDLTSIDSKGLSLSSVGSFFSACFLMIKGFFQSWRLIMRFRPDVVCGFGGYGAFPVVLSSVVLGKPAIIHEQNVVPGRANAVLSKFVRKIAVSFKESQQYFNTAKTVVTGCPCHIPGEQLTKVQGLEHFKLRDDRFTVLVLGGSQGSQKINRVFIDALQDFKRRKDMQAIHISGSGGYEELKEKYGRLGMPFCLFEFLEDIGKAYRAADVVISRAGAVTMTEIAMFHLPSILVPYPGAQGHQKKNALMLANARVAEIIEEKDLDRDALKNALEKTMNDRLSETIIAERVRGFCFLDSSQRLAREIQYLGV